MDFLEPLLIWLVSCFPFFIPLIVPVGSYGFYKHAARHTDGTDDIQDATSAQKGLMTAAQAEIVDSVVEWTAWTPGLTNLSGYDVARYFRIGNICFWRFNAEGKNVTGAGVVNITLPFTTANTGGYCVPVVQIYILGVWTGVTHAMIAANSNLLTMHKTEAAGAWLGTENGVIIRAAGWFEIA